MSILISDTSAWIKKIPSEQLQDADFVRIVNFFVFHSPCKGLSAMGVSLAEYGWSNPWKSPFYLNKQLRQAATNYELLFSAQNRTTKKNQSAVENKEAKKDMMEMALEKSGLKDHFPHSFEKEVICFRNNKNNQFISAFYHIRNALAHGRFCIVSSHSEYCPCKVLGKAQQAAESPCELLSQRYSAGCMEVTSHLILVWN